MEASMSLVEQLQKSDTDRLAEARLEYVKIVGRADRPEPGDTGKLAEIIPLLKINLDQVKADIQALADVKKREKDLLSPERRKTLDAASHSAFSALQAHEKAAKQRHEELKRAFDIAYTDRHLSVELDSNAKMKISELKRSHPRIFQ
jgi:hypothetical protein